MKWKLEEINNQLRILCRDLAHISLKKDELIGFQSWIMDNEGRATTYFIEYYFRDGMHFKSEYVDKNDWIEILKLIGKLELI